MNTTPGASVTTPRQADFFLVPLLDGQFGLGQVVTTDGTPENTCLCLLSDRKIDRDAPQKPIATPEMISLLLVETAHFKNTTWPIIGFETLPDVGAIFNWRKAKEDGFATLTPHDPAVVEAFVNACFGLFPWNGFAGEDFFDAFLINPDRRPLLARIDNDI